MKTITWYFNQSLRLTENVVWQVKWLRPCCACLCLGHTTWVFTVHSNTTGTEGSREQSSLKQKLLILLNKFVPLVMVTSYLLTH